MARTLTELSSRPLFPSVTLGRSPGHFHHSRGLVDGLFQAAVSLYGVSPSSPEGSVPQGSWAPC